MHALPFLVVYIFVAGPKHRNEIQVAAKILETNVIDSFVHTHGDSVYIHMRIERAIGYNMGAKLTWSSLVPPKATNSRSKTQLDTHTQKGI